MCRCARAAVAAALAVVLGGCSAADDTPRQVPAGPASSTGRPDHTATASPTPALPTTAEVFQGVRTFALAAGSGRVTGTVERDGERLGVEVEGNASGTNQTLLLTLGHGGTAEVRTVGDGHWLAGDEAFWTEQTGSAEAARAALGKYVPISEADATEMGVYTLRRLLTDRFARPEVAALEASTVPVVEDEVGGRAAWRLGEDGGARLWVAADGSTELLRLVVAGPGASDLAFADWDRARTFTEPAPEDILEQ